MSIDWDSAVLAPLFDVFAEPVVYTPFNQRPFSARGVFDDAYEGIDLIGGMPVNSSMPILGIRLAEFPAMPEQDDTLQIVRTREVFTVKDVRPDSHGSAKLLLQLAP